MSIVLYATMPRKLRLKYPGAISEVLCCDRSGATGMVGQRLFFAVNSPAEFRIKGFPPVGRPDKAVVVAGGCGAEGWG